MRNSAPPRVREGRRARGEVVAPAGAIASSAIALEGLPTQRALRGPALAIVPTPDLLGLRRVSAPGPAPRLP
eukprot:2795789-Alexandrium_andersonii.AAC.1